MTAVQLERHFSRFSLRTLLILLSAVALLTYLSMRAESVSPKIHYEYSKLLRDLRESDVNTNSEVFSNRLNISRNYDALMYYMEHALQRSEQVADMPAFLPETDQKMVAESVKALHALLADKARLVEIFKRKNSVLRNSQAYFPSITDHFQRSGASDLLKSRVERYARTVLSYSESPSPQRAAQVIKARQFLVEQAVMSANRSHINNLLLHGDTIFKYLPEVNQVTNQIYDQTTSKQLEILNQQYAHGHEQAEYIANHFRDMLYLLALTMAAYLTFLFVRLERVGRSLAKANNEINLRYAAQLQAEGKLRLHATAFHNSHEGIVLADGTGTILDVNPAFERITGYTRKEAIGNNPRLIKSGRHDQVFYEAMWKSIKETGTWQGEIWNKNKNGDIYPELLSISSVIAPEGNLTNYVAVFSDISSIKEQENQLKHLAHYDALTGLPNRVLLAEHMSQGMKLRHLHGQFMAVIYLDLDGFKTVNDNHGHDIGDKLLVCLSARMKQVLREGDTLARIGGDEFVAVLQGLNEIETSVARFLERMLEAASSTTEIDGLAIRVSASLGVTFYPQAEEVDADQLLRQADQAMYQAKLSGKNRYHIFDAEHDNSIRGHHESLEHIRSALTANQFVLYYQPKVNMRTGEMIGAEALIRWQHPTNGLLAPGVFLPVIEEHPLELSIGEWVIESALMQIETWQRAGHNIPVSVNISAYQLQHPDFVQKLKDLLAAHPAIGPGSLEIEVLETSALNDINNVSDILNQCQQLGIRFALDDFGTGYSSLTYLKRLPVSQLKIDQSFVRDMLDDPDDLAILEGILGLAIAFRREVIAEGVETAECGGLLLQLGCELAQGFGIARPMPGEMLPDWSKSWQPEPSWRDKYPVSRNDYPLLFASVEHSANITAIREYMTGERSAPLDRNVNQCSFAQWLANKHEITPGIATAHGLHQAMHEITSKVLALHAQGKTTEAEQNFDTLQNLHSDFLAHLQTILEPNPHPPARQAKL